jgi:hypothetical protein
MPKSSYDIANLARQIHEECLQNVGDTHEITMRPPGSPDYTVLYVPGMDHNNVQVEVGCRGDGGVSYGVYSDGIEVNRGLRAVEVDGRYVLSDDDDEPLADLEEAARVYGMIKHAFAYVKFVRGIND